MAMLTYTDRVVLPTIAAPSLVDIAVSLSRQPRFGGHTRRWWSVLDHTLFCDELVKLDLQQFSNIRPIRLAMLLHDAHEAITADVPTDAKGVGMRMLQADIDIAIMDRYFPNGMAGYRGWTANVKHFDLVALIAEAQVVGPPVSQSRLEEVEPRFARTGPEHFQATLLLHSLLLGRAAAGRYTGPNVAVPGTVAALYGRPPLEMNQEKHPAVKEFLTRITTLM
jgi:hypothetical protein